MSSRFLAETGVIVAVGLAVFGWIFTQSDPLPDLAKTSTKQAENTSGAAKRGDQVPSVPKSKTTQIKLRVEAVGLETPGDVAPAVTASDVLQVTATSLKLRSEPTSSSDMIDVYARGAKFEKIGQEGRWLQVRSTDDGTTGWMYGEYLSDVN